MTVPEDENLAIKILRLRGEIVKAEWLALIGLVGIAVAIMQLSVLLLRVCP